MTTKPTKSDIDLDLDALAPPKVNIKYNGKTIEVHPLELEQFAKYYELAQEMAKTKQSDSVTKITATLKKVEAFVREVIPDLEGQTLNQVQVTAIFGLLGELNQTQDKALEELKKRGIELKKGAQKPKPKASTS